MLSRPVKIYFDDRDELIISWQNQIEAPVRLGATMCINLKKVDVKVLKAVLKQKRYYDKRMDD